MTPCQLTVVTTTLAPPRALWRSTIHPRNFTSLFRYLFPRTHKRLSNRLIDFQLDTLPAIKHKAQSRIYQAILRSQRRKQERLLAGRGLLRRFLPRSRRRPSLRAPENAGRAEPGNTAKIRSMASSGWTGEARVSGHRRQKVLGYIKAANELRQTYQQTISNRWQEADYQEGMPGAFLDADIVRNGEEEMLLFPSYARKHTKATHASQEGYRAAPGAHDGVNHPEPGDADYWKNEWHKYEDQNAVVDVDVRGWIFTPQRGPLNRRNRLLLAVARRLSGIPAPTTNSPSHSRDSSQGPGWRDRIHEDMMSQEEEAAAREAEMIARRGQREAEAASQGRYVVDNDTLLDFSPANSRSSSPVRHAALHMTTSTGSEPGDNITPAQKRQSWGLSDQMSNEEIATANEQLMARLRPFMTMPLADTPITIFFYSETKSLSKSVHTDDSGHFKVRAALDFVPTKVRVLASEKLSATEDVVVTDSRGISIVSDIDDTIKHSAIASGAKEIFKNTFIRELGELTVPGVKEWYTKMASLGVQLHYVSNSPWQLYPLLVSYFKLAGLPPGSFHLKQYTGMLQGIFEPAGERKKGSLDRIMHDFPERKFILIGDSGEADLEVYTDIVQEHPGRVLGVFIRDVTRKNDKNLKDSSYNAQMDENGRRSRPQLSRSNTKQEEVGPKLPQRPKPTSVVTEDLIDFGEEESKPSDARSSMYPKNIEELQQIDKSPPQRPAKPVKPSSLRSITTTASAAPPAPPPRRTATSQSIASNNSLSTHSNDKYHTQNRDKIAPPPPASSSTRTPWQDSAHSSSSPSTPMARPDEGGYFASARHQLSSAYNALPALRSQHSGSSLNASDSSQPPLPPRRGLSSYPAAAARFVTGASAGDPSAGGDGGAPGAPYDKKLEMWKRRWARSEEIMRKHGVVLKTWRNGADVMGDCERLVEKGLREIEREKSRDET